MSVVHQNILFSSKYPKAIRVRRVPAEVAAHQVLHDSSVSKDEGTNVVGIAYHFSRKPGESFMCLANFSSAFIIFFDSKATTLPKKGELAALLCADVNGVEETPTAICKRDIRLVGFGMARIAIHVNQATRLHVLGIDLSTLFSPNIREPHQPSRIIAERVDQSVNRFEVDKLWMDMNGSPERDTVLQAWLATCVGYQHTNILAAAPKLDTRHISAPEQACLYQIVTQSDALESIKPTEVKNEFSKEGVNKDGKLELQNTRYKTRVRRSERTQVVMIDEKGNEFRGTARSAKGKTTTINIDGKGYPKARLREVKVIGRADLTNPEKARDELIFRILTGHKTLQGSPFIRKLWFPRWRCIDIEPTVIDFYYADAIARIMKLNDSQCAAMHSMVGGVPLVIVHGPPGTGKTTTIAAACRIWSLCQLPVWIVAHSNVAVKNIAETLFKKDVDFKLLVSKEFYDEWHEHLYGDVAARLIRSDELPKDKVGMERMISGSSIVLCTLSMISNPTLYENGTFDIVGPERLVIDEASQINVFDFMSIFERFQGRLEKVCFFGDPKQLPPHGQDDVADMKTIFDIEHLKEARNFHFLNISYRMPSTIATFISGFVYAGKLLGQHTIQSPDCLAFIDANRTGEEKAGTSRRNSGEIDVIVHLVRSYYRGLNFCIITPYDAQRAAIQRRLEDENLPWQTVYNLDSFQGNEADYILISVVRSEQAGFLHSQQRMNVLLTRCKKGMILVSSSRFLGPNGSGSETLLGRLVSYWRAKYPTFNWIDWRSVANASADLPGVIAPRPRSLLFPTFYTSSSYTARSSFTPFSVPGNSFQHGYPFGNLHIRDGDFPPLAPKVPLLPGSWAASAFAKVQPPIHHPLSFIHRHQITASSTATGRDVSDRLKRNKIPDLPTPGNNWSGKAIRQQRLVPQEHINTPSSWTRPSGSKSNTVQSSFVPRADRVQSHPQTKSHKGKIGANDAEKRSKTTNPSASGFIRSVTVYSRT